MNSNSINSGVIWLTGLSGSGKSTIGEELTKVFSESGVAVEYIDGDVVRSIFPQTGFSREDRNNHIKRIGYIAHLLEKHSVLVICSFVSPYKESREFARNLCKNFFEVYVSTPLSICEKRDVKGLYAKARKGQIKQFTGIDDPYEEPENPELRIDTSVVPLNECIHKIIEEYVARIN